ncbi:Cytochrome c oxidase subunit CcoO [Methylophaga thiooxydans]|uniref:Cytochrome c oxidase, cbb3-type, subunit II n=2 Tax=Methylophaga thiooxydans TaxID=392484 RepID=C0N506_9GAMM|nr:cytochrome-c oxidase, cbb3-type subunit II [Methylophaga thiooxydans]EEF80136.1 cytochrome c oxidase, cbb3-type, subunit II [Methylophaga thiooxydans DMS010]KGM06380.1 Cytochrome c oxidase subunit CcoO [Methylophaga thiooxydans]
MSDHNSNKPVTFQEKLEKNIWALVLATALVVSVGGIVEIVPLFYLDTTFEDDVFPEYEELKGVRPYTALELAGRDIYQREGCYLCHSQMVRPFRDEKDRYGHYSLAVESKYDHPFQWGSKRTGPDLARVGGKYSDAWQIQHLRDPRSVVPESVMPGYPWLDKATVDGVGMEKRLRAMKALGVPYTDEQINAAAETVEGKTEMQALVAYLQVLGTMVKFEPGRDYRD